MAFIILIPIMSLVLFAGTFIKEESMVGRFINWAWEGISRMVAG